MRKAQPVFVLLAMSLIPAISLSASAATAAHTAHVAHVKEKLVHGKVTIPHSLQKKISKNAALYIIARPNGITAGPPVAVKRFTAPFHFPISFTLGQADSMMGVPLRGPLSLSARISQSGSANPAGTGDILTRKPVNNVKAGGKHVILHLDEVKK